MKRLRISPSLLDEFRATMAGLWGKNDESLKAYIEGPRIDTPAMARGRAYHRVLEWGGTMLWKGRNDEWFSVHEKETDRLIEFHRDALAPALAAHERYAAMLHEVKQKAVLQIAGYEVEMNMRWDGLHGLDIHEFKTTGTAPTYLKYYDSLQWRCYLLPMPEIRAVNYTVFHLNDANDRCNVESYTMHREEGNRENIEYWLNHFLGWLEARPHYLEILEAKAVNVD